MSLNSLFLKIVFQPTFLLIYLIFIYVADANYGKLAMWHTRGI